MNKKHKDEELFKKLRELPPEISEAKVHAIIKGLPLLPIPKTHWIHQINLNSIIMSTTVITFIVGTTLLLTNVDKQAVIVENSEPTPAEVVVPTALEEEKEISEIEESITFENKPSKVSSLPKRSTPSLTPLSKQNIPTLPSPKIKDLPKLNFQTPTIEDISIEEAPIEENMSFMPLDLNLDPCKNRVKISDVEVDFLKISLLSKLKRDQLIASKKDKMIIAFNKNGVLVNNQLIPNSLQNKYSDFLNKYNITPCGNRIVITTDEYIAVGNQTAEGFKGTISGRVDLGELDIYQGYGSPLFPQKGERKIGNFHSLKIKGLAVVYLSNKPSETAKLKVTGMPMNDVITKVVDGVLMIDTKGQHNGEKISIEIGATNLKSIEVGGSAELRSEEQLKSEEMSLFLTDTGSAWLDVDIKTLKINMLGGDLFIKGHAKKQDISFDKDYERGTLRNNLINK